MRITKYMREGIVERLARTLDAPVEEAKKNITEYIAEAVKPRCRLLAKAPEELLPFLHTASIIYICRNFYVPLETPMPITPGENEYYVELESNPVFEELKKAYNLAVEDKKAGKRRIEAVIASCSTTKQLIELIPEAAKILPDEFSSVAREFAIVPIEDVNFARDAVLSVTKKLDTPTES